MQKVFQNIAGNVGLNLLAQGLTLLFVPLLSQVYDLSSYGRFATFLAVSSLVAVFAGYRLDVAALSAAGEEEAHRLLSISVMLSILVAFALLLLSLLPALRGLGTALALAAPLTALIQAASSGLIRAQRIGPIAVGRLLNTVVMGGAQLAFGRLHVEHGLILGFLAGATANALYLLTVWRPGVQRFSLWSVLRMYRAFGVTSALAAAVNALTLQAPQLVLANLFSPAAAGAFAIAQRLTVFPVTLIAQPLSQAYAGRVSTALREGRPVAPLFIRYTQAALALGVALALSIAEVAPWLLRHVISADWQNAQVFIPASAAMLLPTLLLGSVGLTLNLLRRTGTQLRWDVARLLAVATTFALASVLGISAPLAVWAFVGVLVMFAGGYAGLVLGEHRTAEVKHVV